jgi:hypothetical protein
MPGWHLKAITLEHLQSKALYTFVCDRWLARSEDDKEIVRELPATGSLVKTPLKVCF